MGPARPKLTEGWRRWRVAWGAREGVWGARANGKKGRGSPREHFLYARGGEIVAERGGNRLATQRKREREREREIEEGRFEIQIRADL